MYIAVAQSLSIITVLVHPSNSQTRRGGVAFPPDTLIAIENVSMPNHIYSQGYSRGVGNQW